MSSAFTGTAPARLPRNGGSSTSPMTTGTSRRPSPAERRSRASYSSRTHGRASDVELHTTTAASQRLGCRPDSPADEDPAEAAPEP